MFLICALGFSWPSLAAAPWPNASPSRQKEIPAASDPSLPQEKTQQKNSEIFNPGPLQQGEFWTTSDGKLKLLFRWDGRASLVDARAGKRLGTIKNIRNTSVSLDGTLTLEMAQGREYIFKPSWPGYQIVRFNREGSHDYQRGDLKLVKTIRLIGGKLLKVGRAVEVLDQNLQRAAAYDQKMAYDEAGNLRSITTKIYAFDIRSSFTMVSENQKGRIVNRAVIEGPANGESDGALGLRSYEVAGILESERQNQNRFPDSFKILTTAGRAVQIEIGPDYLRDRTENLQSGELQKLQGMVKDFATSNQFLIL